MTTFSQVDKHIRKLDSDLARFEVEIQDKAISIATKIVEESSQKRKRHCCTAAVPPEFCLFNLQYVCRRPQKDNKRQ